MLFENVGVSLKLMMPTIFLIGGFFIGISYLAYRAYSSRPKGGMDGLIGETGVVEKRIDPAGTIFVHGEYWSAVCDEVAEQGEKVQVSGSKGLELIVEKIEMKYHHR
jgi:membrane-bound serine protease (ClpP class)